MMIHLGQPELLGLLGGMPAAERAATEAFGHLAYCTECAARLDALREIRRDPEEAWREFMGALGGAPDARFHFVLGLVVDAARGVAAIAARGLDSVSAALEGYHVAFVPAVAGAAAPEAASPAAGESARVEVRVMGPEIGAATVIADSRRNAISVLLVPPAGTTPEEFARRRSPRAVLVGPAGTPRREAVFETVVGADYLLAEFERLEATEWTLGFDLGG